MLSLEVNGPFGRELEGVSITGALLGGHRPSGFTSTHLPLVRIIRGCSLLSVAFGKGEHATSASP